MPALLPHCVAYINKIAASRLDKEVARGAASYSDVDPRIPRPMGQSNMAKRISRAEGMAPAARTPDEVNRVRTLSDALFKNQHARADEALLREELLAHPPTGELLSPGFPTQYDLLNEMSKAGPGTHALGAGSSTVYAPDTSSQFLRTTAKPLGIPRAALHAYLPPNVRDRMPGLLVPPADVDRTLNYGVLEHELGEATSLANLNITPFASHLGIDPITRENMALRGDPEAQDIMSRVRRMHPDDALVQRKLREAGNTSNSPLPVGGRASRSVEKNIGNNPQWLGKKTRNKAVKQQTYLDNLRRISQGDVPMPMQNIRTLPQHVKDSISSGGDTVQRELNAIKALPKDQRLLGGLRRAIPTLKELAPQYKTLRRFLG